MKLTTISGLVIGILSASFAVVNAADAESTPFPEPELVEDAANIELRQNLGVAPTATLAGGQVPPVTIYTIASQVGATAAEHVITFTQTFQTPVDQWPSAKPGVIGLKKRDAVPSPEPMHYGVAVQPVVLAMETVFVTQELQRQTRILVVETAVVRSNVIGNGTQETRNTTSPAAMSPEAHHIGRNGSMVGSSDLWDQP